MKSTRVGKPQLLSCFLVSDLLGLELGITWPEAVGAVGFFGEFEVQGFSCLQVQRGICD